MESFRIQQNKTGLEFGLYSLGDHMPDSVSGKGISAQERLDQIISAAQLAEEAGFDFFSIGESHQKYFVGQAHAVILGAIAQATKTIKIGSAATILSTSDPVRVYENFATIDLLSHGRAEIIAGRASRTGLFDLLGYDKKDYEALFEEKFDLLLQINATERLTWQGEYRASLDNALILPRPAQGKLPIWRAVGGQKPSAIKAGQQGVPMALAMLGGHIKHYQYVIEAYREALVEAGYQPEQIPLATTGLCYVAETTQQAMKEFYPYVDEGMRKANGTGWAKEAFAQSSDLTNVMVLGSPQEVIEKLLYQAETFGHQRYMAQIDFGGMPFKQVMKTIDKLGSIVMPAVKKYTKK